MVSAIAAALLCTQSMSKPLNDPAIPQAESAVLATVDKLLSALNGDQSARLSAIQEMFSSGALGAQSVGSRAAEWDRLSRMSGGFSLAAISPRSANHVDLILKSNKGDIFATAVVFMSLKEPEKIGSIFFLPARDPAKTAIEVWPDKPILLSDLPREIDWRIKRRAADDVFSGAVLVARGDDVIYRKAFGPANRTTGTLNRADTLFHSASVSKMFTSVAVLRLDEQRLLSLDDTLAKWVPEYPDQIAAKHITLRQLLTHTAGLAHWEKQFEPYETSRAAARTMTAALAAKPGARMSYSNAGYVLLGAVIEKVTGKRLEVAIGNLVLQPARMRFTTYKSARTIANRATLYHRSDEDPIGFKGLQPDEGHLNLSADASGGAYTSVDDMFRFHRALYKNRLLRPKATTDILEPKVDFPGTPRPSKYGYGIRFGACSGKQVFGHSGGGPNAGVSAATYATRDGEWTVIVLSNYVAAGEELAISLCEAVTR